MKICNKTKIGSHWLETKYKSESKDGFEPSARNYGWICELWIQADAKRSKQEVSYLHEILHEVDFLYALDLKEHQITALASALHQVLTDNDLVK